MPETIFKITDTRNRSVFSKVYPPSLRIQYKVGEYVEPKTPALAFRRKKDAIGFIPNRSLGVTPFKMWQCEAEDIKEVKTIICTSVLFNSGKRRAKAINRIESFWGEGNFWNKFCQPAGTASANPPVGTVSAKRIKLVKQVMEAGDDGCATIWESVE